MITRVSVVFGSSETKHFLLWYKYLNYCIVGLMAELDIKNIFEILVSQAKSTLIESIGGRAFDL